MNEQEQKRASLVWMLNAINEQIDEYPEAEYQIYSKPFKELCNKRQRILKQIEDLDKETLSI